MKASRSLNLVMSMNQLAGLANNTKWTELQTVMAGLGRRAPYWRTKSTNGFIYPETGWDGDWSYHFRLGPYKFIEWCEMIPNGSEGALTQIEVEDLCTKIGFETELNESVVRVLGYRRL